MESAGDIVGRGILIRVGAVVTGDTKVVDKGKADKVFINTSGIGILDKKHIHISSGDNVEVGDKIIINGSIGDHGMTIMSARNELNIRAKIESDCACLNHLIEEIIESGAKVKFMRDATRGGVATVLTELVEKRNYGLETRESDLVVKDGVRGMCELLGFDPLYVANEGKVVMVVSEADASNVLNIMHASEFGKDATIIGEIVDEHHGKGWIETGIGGKQNRHRKEHRIQPHLIGRADGDGRKQDRRRTVGQHISKNSN